MSWVCDICSCNNDDENMECFVCGSHRSEASIREAKRSKLEKKLDNISEFLYNKMFFWIKIVSIAIAALFLAGGIIKIAQGKIFYDISNNFNNIFNNFIKNSGFFLKNVEDIQFIKLIQLRFNYIGRFILEWDLPISINDILNQAATNIFHNSTVLINNFVQLINWESKIKRLGSFHLEDNIRRRFEYIGTYFCQADIPVSFTRFLNQMLVKTEKNEKKSLDAFNYMLPVEGHVDTFLGLFKNSQSNVEKFKMILNYIVSGCGESFQCFFSIATHALANVATSFDKLISATTYAFGKSKNN